MADQQVDVVLKARIKERDDLFDQIRQLEQRFVYLKTLKELKEKRERENAGSIVEYLLEREYCVLKEYIEILKCRLDLLRSKL